MRVSESDFACLGFVEWIPSFEKMAPNTVNYTLFVVGPLDRWKKCRVDGCERSGSIYWIYWLELNFQATMLIKMECENLGELIQLGEYFSNGLKPPTRKKLQGTTI